METPDTNHTDLDYAESLWKSADGVRERLKGVGDAG
jgi:hypothetical protein